MSERATSSMQMSPERRTAILILIAFVLRCALAASTGLGIDETYTVSTGRIFTLSTFDHPPLAWWLARCAGLLLGEGDFALRLPFLLLFVLTSWLMFLLTRRLFGGEAGFFATLALTLAPVFSLADGIFILPDGPLLAAMLGCALALSHVFFDDDRRAGAWWLLAGACAGLAMLSKYHGALLFAGAGLFMLTSPRPRAWLLTPWPWLAALLALAIFSPVIVWNVENHWISFAYQGGRPGAAQFRPLAPLVLVGLQSLIVTPWLYFPLLALLFRAWTRGVAEEKPFFLACLATPILALFTLPAFWSAGHVLPHWAAPGFIPLLPLLGREIAARIAEARWLRRALVAVCAFVATAVAVLVALPYQSFAALSGPRYPLFELLDWNEVPRAFEQRRVIRPNFFVATLRWADAGKLDYALRDKLPVLCLALDPHAYGLLRDAGAHVGEDALIVAPRMSLEEVKAQLAGNFDEIVADAPIDILQGGRPAIRLNLYRATNFHDPKPEFFLRARQTPHS